jgi:hypothetical protein
MSGNDYETLKETQKETQKEREWKKGSRKTFLYLVIMKKE